MLLMAGMLELNSDDYVLNDNHRRCGGGDVLYEGKDHGISLVAQD